MFRKKNDPHTAEQLRSPATDEGPRAPLVIVKLDGARAVLAALETEVGELALEAVERKPGAADRLTAHRAKIAAAKTAVAELEAALRLAERLDRQTAAEAVEMMRAEQLADFKRHMAARQGAMAAVLEAAATMAQAYGDYSEATLAAQIFAPTGTTIPVMTIGPNGMFGPAFGRCERLVLGELFRLAPHRVDGVGRFVLPFAESPNEMVRHQPEAIPPGLEEFRAAAEVIVAEIERQMDHLNNSARAAIEREAA
jgi:hypothetical protein